MITKTVLYLWNVTILTVAGLWMYFSEYPLRAMTQEVVCKNVISMLILASAVGIFTTAFLWFVISLVGLEKES